jgi:hypothetical protein
VLGPDGRGVQRGGNGMRELELPAFSRGGGHRRKDAR